MATGFWLSQAICVAAKLGIADLRKEAPKSCVVLARWTRSDAPSLFRLLRTLASVGVFSHLGEDQFDLFRLAENLWSDVAGSLRSTVITIGEIHYQACEKLLYSVKTGAPAFHNVFGTSLFDYLQQNVEAASAFNRGMTNLSSMTAYALLMAYIGGISSIIVGRGEGALLRRILELNRRFKVQFLNCLQLSKQQVTAPMVIGAENDVHISLEISSSSFRRELTLILSSVRSHSRLG